MKDQSIAKDFSHKVLHENKKETEENNVKPQEQHRNQENPIEEELRKENNKMKDNQIQGNENELKSKVEFTEHLKRRASLPFPAASGRFFARQYDKTTKNVQREKRRTEKPALIIKNDIIGLQRSHVEGNLENNKESIENKIKRCKDQSKRVQLLGVAEVAKELQKVLLMPTSRAQEIYKATKATFSGKKV